MKAKLKIVALIIGAVLGGTSEAFSQEGPCVVPTNSVGRTVLNPWRKDEKPSRKPVPYPNVREADVMWSKRVWRTIDLREKMNLQLRYPLEPHPDRKSLFDVLKDGIRCGEITAYGNAAFDDEFGRPLSKTEAEDIMVHSDTLDLYDPETDRNVRTPIREEVSSERVVQYWIKEDWFFDRSRSAMDVRIIGICPLVEKLSENGEVIGLKPLFWVYYPEARNLLVRWEVYMGQNNALPITFDDLFVKRIFNGYITKEDNVYDRRIGEFLSGQDALIEGEGIKEDIMNFESDLWHY